MPILKSSKRLVFMSCVDAHRRGNHCRRRRALLGLRSLGCCRMWLLWKWVGGHGFRRSSGRNCGSLTWRRFEARFRSRRHFPDGVRRFLLRLGRRMRLENADVSSSGREADGQFVVVEQGTKLLCRIVAVPVAKAFGGGGADREVLVGESVDERFVNCFRVFFREHVDSGGPSGIPTVFVNVVDGFYTEPERAKKET